MRATYLAGAALLLFQAFFIFVPMTILGGAIDWPASLDFPPEQTLPLVHEHREAVRLGYAFYLGWSLVFAGSAAYIVGLARGSAPAGTLASLAIAFGVTSALARAIGIVRWLTGSSALASAYAEAPAGSPERLAIETTQLAVNAYGGSIGEDLGVSVFAVLWLVCVGVLILKDEGLPAWLGWSAFPVGAIGLMPALPIIGIMTPVGVAVGTSAMFLWIAAVALVLAARAMGKRAATTNPVAAAVAA